MKNKVLENHTLNCQHCKTNIARKHMTIKGEILVPINNSIIAKTRLHLEVIYARRAHETTHHQMILRTKIKCSKCKHHTTFNTNISTE
ncbi:hypothetical protein D3C81_519840 [compost metagenome]